MSKLSDRLNKEIKEKVGYPPLIGHRPIDEEYVEQQEPIPYDVVDEPLDDLMGDVMPKQVEPELTMYEEIEQNPTPKGLMKVNIYGEIMDLRALEDYVQIFSPKSMTTLLRDTESEAKADALSIKKIKPMKTGLGTILLIVGGAIGIALLGLFILTNPDAITNFMQGLTGGL